VHDSIGEDSSAYFRGRLYRGREGEENHGREFRRETNCPASRYVGVSRTGDATRWTRVATPASAAPSSGPSPIRSRRVPVDRMTSNEHAIARNRRPIFSPGGRERGVYGRAQNGRRQERSTVRERERASETSFLSFSTLLSRFLLRLASFTRSLASAYNIRARARNSLSLSLSLSLRYNSAIRGL